MDLNGPNPDPNDPAGPEPTLKDWLIMSPVIIGIPALIALAMWLVVEYAHG